MLLGQPNLVYCQFNSYFTFITEGRLIFSLICSFYCCLVKEGWTPENCLAICHRGLFAYKPVVYKKIKYMQLSFNKELSQTTSRQFQLSRTTFQQL